MFKRISYRIAVQFMAFVFLLLIVNGALFLAADFGNARQQTHARLLRLANLVTDDKHIDLDHPPKGFPPMVRDRVRILSLSGQPTYSGAFFEEIPVSQADGFSDIVIQNQQYSILTLPLIRAGDRVGYIQFADVEHFQLAELPRRAIIYLLVSIAISAITFAVGLFFARRSLQPAEQMMRRLEQFTQDASHELRTPLAALSSSLDLALKTKKYREGILSAKDDLREVSVLVERLLELARLDQFALAMAPVDLSALLNESIERFRPLAAEKNVTITSAVDPAIKTTGDALLIRQVVGNLLSNAIKFSKAGGGMIRVVLSKRTLSIEDSGIGIPADALNHIFDRFYQAETSRSNDGFGLGLALVKRIVDLHGWTVGVKSVEGKGTTFTISFSR